MRSKKEIYHAAIYLRISRDDEDKSESDSIQNQRELLKAYIEKHPELELTDEFVDDGYSGTNFERPGFQKMMDMVQEKTIDCIIVKDLSRLGRNYIETGRFIDQIFPKLGVRFISVNDNYDSFNDNNDADQIIIPFKNLINDAYCRDISMKIRSQLDVKRKSGKFIGPWAGYGYLKDPKDKHHLIVDQKAADIVKMIFDMKLEGYSLCRIADKLNELGVLTPLQYKRSIGLKCNAGYWKGEEHIWVAATVLRILTNELYIGNMVQGKNRKINYKIKYCQPVEEKDWIRVKNTHEPIVTKAVFDRVQELLRDDTRTSPNMETVNLLGGLVRCGDCGQNMVLTNRHKNERTYKYYICSTAKSSKDCGLHMINADKLEEIVLSAVQNQMRLLIDAERLIETAGDVPLKSHKVKILEDQILSMEGEISRYQEMKERLYEDYQDEIIDKDDYEELKERFVKNIDQSTQIKRNLEQKKTEAIDEPILPPEWLDEVKAFNQVNMLTRKIVVMLINRIVVYSKDRVEIIFRYGDEIEALIDYKNLNNVVREGTCGHDMC